MDSYTLSTASLNAHQVEVYTSTLLIRGIMVGPFNRTSDLVNRRDRHNLIVQDASLVPVGSSATPKPISDPVYVARSQIHLVTAIPTPENATDPYLSGPLPPGQLPTGPISASGPLTTRGLTGQAHGTPSGSLREYQVKRVAKPCYIFTSTFVISGLCHLLEGSTIENLLDSQDPFFPLTQGIAYLHTKPDAPWRRDLFLINKDLIQSVYTADAHPTTQLKDAPPRP